MNYKPNKQVMDLLMPESRRRNIVPQKLIEEIILDYFESVSVEDRKYGNKQGKQN